MTGKSRIKRKVVKEQLTAILKKINKNYANPSFKKNLQYQNIDSIDYLNFILKVQSKLKINLNNKELNKIKTLNNLITLISKKL